ncbi:MAG: response regulator, partial [Litorivicinus sp.]
MSDRPLDVRRPAPNGDAKILLIDDEPKVLAPLARLLINSGMRIFTSTNGTEGCKNAIANGPDLILLDVGLPDLSGFEVLRLLKSHHRVADTPVIMMTAANDHDSRVRGWTLGCVDYVTKPFHLDEVKLRIDLHLSLSRQARPADTDASEPLMLSGHTNKDEMLVNAAIGILRDTIANPPGLADLARQLGTNEKRLTQAF